MEINQKDNKENKEIKKLKNELNSKIYSPFSNSKEWSDLLSIIKELDKILQKYEHFNYSLLPNKLILAKRLNQCLNPSLPGGLHQKVLETYLKILKNILEKNNGYLGNNLSLFSSGLFPSFLNTNIDNKMFYLNKIINEIYLNLNDIEFETCLSGLIVSILPGLEDQNEKLNVSIKSTFQKFLEKIGKYKFFGVLWTIILRNKKMHLSGMKIVNDLIPNYENLKEQYENNNNIFNEYFPNFNTTVINSLCEVIDDISFEEVGIVRIGMDFLNTKFPLKEENNFISENDKITLLKKSLNLYIKNEYSLVRRLNNYILNNLNDDEIDTNSKEILYIINLLIQTFKKIFKNEKLNKINLKDNFKILEQFILNQKQICKFVIEKIFYNIAQCVSNYWINDLNENENIKKDEIIDKIIKFFNKNEYLEILWESLKEKLIELNQCKINGKNNDDIKNYLQTLKFCLLFLDIKDKKLKIKNYISIINNLLIILTNIEIEKESLNSLKKIVFIILVFIKNLQKLKNEEEEKINDENNNNNNNENQINYNNKYIINSGGNLKNILLIEEKEKIFDDFSKNIKKFENFYINIIKIIFNFKKEEKISFNEIKFFKQINEILIRLLEYTNYNKDDNINFIYILEQIIFKGNYILSYETSNFLIDILLCNFENNNLIYNKIKNILLNEKLIDISFEEINKIYIKNNKINNNFFEYIFVFLYSNLNDQSKLKNINLLMKLFKINSKKFIELIKNSLDEPLIQQENLKIFIQFWKSSNENFSEIIFFEKGECLFNVLDFLDCDNPLLRHLSKAWLNQTTNQLYKIIDPLLKVLIKNFKEFKFNNENNEIYVDKEYDTKLIMNVLRKFKNVILNNNVFCTNYLIKNKPSQYIINLYEQFKINKNDNKHLDLNYLNLIIEIALKYIQVIYIANYNNDNDNDNNNNNDNINNNNKDNNNNENNNNDNNNDINNNNNNDNKKDNDNDNNDKNNDNNENINKNDNDNKINIDNNNNNDNIDNNDNNDNNNNDNKNNNNNNYINKKIFNNENISVNATSCEFLEYLLNNIENKKYLLKISYNIFSDVTDILLKYLEKKNEVMEIQILNLLKILLFNVQNIIDQNLDESISIFINNKFIICLQNGITINNFFTRSHFISFVENCLPIFSKLLEKHETCLNLKIIANSLISTLSNFLINRIKIETNIEKVTNKFSFYLENNFIYKNYLDEYKYYKNYDENDVYLILKGMKNIIFHFLNLNENNINILNEKNIDWKMFKEKLIEKKKNKKNLFQKLKIKNSNKNEEKNDLNINNLINIDELIYFEELLHILISFLKTWKIESDKYQNFDFCLNDKGILKFKLNNRENNIKINNNDEEEINEYNNIKNIIINICLNIFYKNPKIFMNNLLSIWLQRDLTNNENQNININIINNKQNYLNIIKNDKTYKLCIIELLISMNIPLNIFLYSLNKIIKKQIKNLNEKNNKKKNNENFDNNIIYFESNLIFFLYSYLIYYDNNNNINYKDFYTQINIFFNLIIYNSKYIYIYCWLYELMNLLLIKYLNDNLYEESIKKDFLDNLTLIIKKLIDCSFFKKFDCKYEDNNLLKLPLLPSIYKKITKNLFKDENLYKIFLNETENNYKNNFLLENINPTENKKNIENKETFNHSYILNIYNYIYKTINNNILLTTNKIMELQRTYSFLILLNLYYQNIIIIYDKNKKELKNIFSDFIKILFNYINKKDSELYLEISLSILDKLISLNPPLFTSLAKQNIMDFFLMNNFFDTNEINLNLWKNIIKNLLENHHEIIKDLIDQLDNNGILFIKTTDNFKIRRTLRRISFVIYSCEIDTFNKELFKIKEKVKTLLTQYSDNEQIECEIFLMLRILFLRFSHENVKDMIKVLWPIIFTELTSIVTNKKKNGVTYLLLKESFKFIELLSLVNIEEFNLYEWIFMLDTFDRENLDIKKEDSLISKIKKDKLNFKPFCMKINMDLDNSDNSELIKGNNKEKNELIIVDNNLMGNSNNYEIINNEEEDENKKLTNLIKKFFFSIGDMNSYKTNINYNQIEQCYVQDFLGNNNN